MNGLRLPIAGVVAALLITAVGSFFLGRGTAPARVETREKVITKTVEVASKQKEESSVSTENTSRRDAERWVVHEVRHHDGTVETTTTSEAIRSSEAAAKREEANRETEIRYVDKYVDREVVKVVTSQATWGLAARAGVRGGFGDYVFGAEVSRRLFGPLWAGVWADTSKAAGLAVRLEF